MTFEALRAQFSHSVLENLLFPYLCGPIAAWQDLAAPDAERAALAANDWRAVTENQPEGLRRVPEIWRAHKGRGVPGLAHEIYLRARDRAPYVPTKTFPSWEQVSSRLEQMNTFILLVESDGYTYVAGREDDARRFWVAAFALYRFIQGLRYGSAEFWEWYEERP